MNNPCDFPKCRNLADLGYIGCNICVVHWEQLCGASSTTEKRLLKKIGLVRNDSGVVVLIKKEKRNGDC